MKGIRKRWWLLALLLAGGGFAYYRRSTAAKPPELRTYVVQTGDLKLSVEAGGTVEPENRVEILPPVAGRVEQILTEQGQRARKGQTLAWMSSTDRAALLDAALAQGPAEYERWKAAYKATPILAPVSGMVIERKIVEGQTVSAGTYLFALADRMVIRARVDESEIAKVRPGQRAEAVADALPEDRFEVEVVRVDFQSKNVGGVMVFQVELLPVDLPEKVRSGMSVRVDFAVEKRVGVSLLPAAAVQGAERGPYTVLARRGGEPEKVQVQLGISDGTNVEVVQGLAPGDEVLVEAPSYELKESSNPFDPFSRRKGDSKGGKGGTGKGGRGRRGP